MNARHPHRLRRWFEHRHLRPELHDTVKGYSELAGSIDEQLPDSPEKTTALHKLAESKDWAVRAKIEADEATDGHPSN